MNINILEPEMFSPIYYLIYSGLNDPETYKSLRKIRTHFDKNYKELKSLMSDYPLFMEKLDVELTCVENQLNYGSFQEVTDDYDALICNSVHKLMIHQFWCNDDCYWEYGLEVFYQTSSD